MTANSEKPQPDTSRKFEPWKPARAKRSVGSCGHVVSEALAVYHLAKGLGSLEVYCHKCKDWVKMGRDITLADILKLVQDPDKPLPKRRPRKTVSDDQEEIPPF